MRSGMHCRMAYKYIAENFIMVIMHWRMTELRCVLHTKCKPCCIHSECVDYRGLYLLHSISMGGVQNLVLGPMGVEVWMLWVQNQCLPLQSFFLHPLIGIISLSSQFSQQTNSVSHFCGAIYFIQGSIHSGIDQDHSINGFSFSRTSSLCLFYRF